MVRKGCSQNLSVHRVGGALTQLPIVIVVSVGEGNEPQEANSVLAQREDVIMLIV
jgi:hypothetical protein